MAVPFIGNEEVSGSNPDGRSILCRVGGIGRHKGLRIPRRKACGFDPCTRHHLRPYPLTVRRVASQAKNPGSIPGRGTILWPVRLSVRIQGFHPWEAGSIPAQAAIYGVVAKRHTQET